MNPLGKTIARLQQDAPDPESGRPSEERLLIHFTDGTALEIVASSYEEATIDTQTLSRDNVLEREHLHREHEKAEAEKAQKRKEWLALSCDERAAQAPKRSHPFFWLEAAMEDSILEQALLASASASASPAREIKLRCPTCGERECPNAPVKNLKTTFWAAI